jgi:NUMOD4 motif
MALLHHSEPNPRPPRVLRTRTRPQSAEQWRPIPYFENVYAISSRGRVQRVAPEPKRLVGKILQPRRRPDGRTIVSLYCRGAGHVGPVVVCVDQLVIEVFQRAAPDIAPDMAAALIRPEQLRQIDPVARARRTEPRSPAGKAAQPDLHRLMGLDAAGLPDPEIAYELHLEESCPELAHEIIVERAAAAATAHLLRLAVEHVNKIMGAGAAHAYPEIVAAVVQSATTIRAQEMRERARRRGEPT